MEHSSTRGGLEGRGRCSATAGTCASGTVTLALYKSGYIHHRHPVTCTTTPHPSSPPLPHCPCATPLPPLLGRVWTAQPRPLHGAPRAPAAAPHTPQGKQGMCTPCRTHSHSTAVVSTQAHRSPVRQTAEAVLTISSSHAARYWPKLSQNAQALHGLVMVSAPVLRQVNHLGPTL